MPSVTARTQTVDDYLRDLGKLEMITPEEKIPITRYEPFDYVYREDENE